MSKKDNLIQPQYYGGAEDPYQPRFVSRAWKLSPNLFSVLKYVKRDGKAEDLNKRIEDLRKAQTYLEFEIEDLKYIADEARKASQAYIEERRPGAKDSGLVGGVIAPAVKAYPLVKGETDAGN